MSDVKLYRKSDNPLTANPQMHAVTLPFINVGNSETMGAGLGLFDTGASIPWTVTYDEVLFIHEGNFTLRVGDTAFEAGPGDTLWIPAHTELVYDAAEPVTFFYAVYPAANSPSTGTAVKFASSPPQRK
jgi:ethanolamine utilization protein EutQ